VIPLRGRGHVATSIFAVLAGRSPAQARSRCLENTEEDVGGAVVRSEPRRMTRPQVAYFLSGVLVYFPSGARSPLSIRGFERRIVGSQNGQFL